MSDQLRELMIETFGESRGWSIDERGDAVIRISGYDLQGPVTANVGDGTATFSSRILDEPVSASTGAQLLERTALCGCTLQSRSSTSIRADYRIDETPTGFAGALENFCQRYSAARGTIQTRAGVQR